jgi:hypothetical protein
MGLVERSFAGLWYGPVAFIDSRPTQILTWTISGGYFIFCRSQQADSHDSTQSPSKRARTAGNTADSMDNTKSYQVTADMDEATRTKIRREKNRVAARKCRAKKMQFMVDLQKTLRELMRKNEEYRLQVGICVGHMSSSGRCRGLRDLCYGISLKCNSDRVCCRSLGLCCIYERYAFRIGHGERQKDW